MSDPNTILQFSHNYELQHNYTDEELLREMRRRNLVPLSEPETALNDYAEACHTANMRWWVDLKTGAPLERNKGELLMLIVSELVEAMEGARKGLMDDKLPHRRMEEVELADALIRIFDYCGGFDLDIHGAYLEKMEYNRNRVDHTHAARQQEGGKKW